VAEWSKAWVCGHLLAQIAGSNPTGGINVSVLSVVFCQVAVSATGQSLVQRVLLSGVSKEGSTYCYITRYSLTTEFSRQQVSEQLVN
jgi:hypothetical protein